MRHASSFRALAAVLAVCLVTSGAAARAQFPVADPATGIFLVAQSSMPDARFRRAVILLVAHGDERGTLGLVLNRPSDASLPATSRRYPVYAGGPVAPDQLVVLGRGQRPDGRVETVWEDVWWSGDGEAIERLLESDRSHAALRIFVGYAGWAPGQLDAELATGGAWSLFRAEPEMIFDGDSDGLWDRFLGTQRPVIAGTTVPGPAFVVRLRSAA